MRALQILRRDERGAGAVEFALALPVLVTMIYGIFEFSQLYEANASMQHALGEGARLATLCVPNNASSTGCTAPTDANITDRETAKLFGPKGGVFNVADVQTVGTYKTLTITYTRTMNFLFFAGPRIVLSRSKQVYVAAPAAPAAP